MKKYNKTIGMILVPAAAVLLYLFLPVPYTIYSQPDDGDLHPADPVTAQTPLQQCFTEAEIGAGFLPSASFQNITGIDLLLATYSRHNSNINHFEIFTLENGKKNILAQQDFSSGGVKDNDYYSISFPQIRVVQTSAGQTATPPKLCFLLTSKDATPQNAITYWLNSQSQPVLKLKSTVPLYKAMEQVAAANRFHLPLWLVVALCLVYLGANLSALFIIWNEPKPPSQQVSNAPSAHPGRARQKRI